MALAYLRCCQARYYWTQGGVFQIPWFLFSEADCETLFGPWTSLTTLNINEHQWTTSPAFESTSSCLGNLQRRSNCEQQGGASRILSHLNPSIALVIRCHHPFPSFSIINSQLYASSLRNPYALSSAAWCLHDVQVYLNEIMPIKCRDAMLSISTAPSESWPSFRFNFSFNFRFKFGLLYGLGESIMYLQAYQHMQVGSS